MTCRADFTAEEWNWIHHPPADETWAARGKPTALYRAHDAHGNLLYIGITTGIGSRLLDHAHKTWGPRIASITLQWLDSEAGARQAETAAIRAEHPQYNRTA